MPWTDRQTYSQSTSGSEESQAPGPETLWQGSEEESDLQNRFRLPSCKSLRKGEGFTTPQSGSLISQQAEGVCVATGIHQMIPISSLLMFLMCVMCLRKLISQDKN